MENETKIEKDGSYPHKSNKSKKHTISKNKTNKKDFYSEYKKKNNKVDKSNINGNKTLLSKKRKDKNKNKNVIPETPHNTGQYLSHIHQGYEPKKKSNHKNKDKDKDKNINHSPNKKEIALFEYDEELDDFGNIDFDYQFIEDKKRDKLMSMEGHNLNDFLFKSKENGSEENKHLIKSVVFNKNKESNKK